MAGNSEILREYLLALGFKVDTTQAKKFDSVLTGVEKNAKNAGIAIAGLATTALAMGVVYAKSMEKLYYSSQKSGSTVKQIQALEYAGEQVGISAEAMRGGIEGMAKALRGNPALVGMLKTLGVKTEGRTSAQELTDLVEALRSSGMSFFQAKGFAAMFGLDEDTYQRLAQTLDKVRELAAEREKMDSQLGVDADKNAEAMVEWLNSVRTVKGELVSLEGVIAKALIEPMREATKVTHEVVSDLSRIIANKNHEGDDVSTRLREALGFKTRDVVQVHGQRAPVTLDSTPADAVDAFGQWILSFTHGGKGIADRRNTSQFDNDFKLRPGGGGGNAAPGGSQSDQELLSNLERQYGLPAGLLDALWQQESSRGANMGTGKRNANGLGGIIGHFQLDSRARKAYEVTDPKNLSQEAVAAAEMMADLLKATHGNLPQALAMWNGGTAARYDMNRAVNPAETKAFVPSVLSKIDQHNHITINAKDSRGVGTAVKTAMDESNGNLLREVRAVHQ